MDRCDWKPILEAYIERYGKKPKEEAKKRKRPEGAAKTMRAATRVRVPTTMLQHAAEDGSNNGGEGDVRPRVETRGARKQAEREKRLPKSMPSASVCIAFEASLWPKDDREFTDGVQEVFLDGCEEEDLQEHEDRDAQVRADVT